MMIILFDLNMLKLESEIFPNIFPLTLLYKVQDFEAFRMDDSPARISIHVYVS